jgi:hypothetical protein
MWQSLSFGANYKAAYCMSVCPAGEDVIEPFLNDRRAYLSTVVTPLQEKKETVFVLAHSDAESHVGRRFPAKKTKRVSSGLRPRTLRSFLSGLSLTFQRERSKDVDATYHFSFHGAEEREVTIRIRNQALEVDDGHVGTPDLRVKADRDTWLGFVAGEKNLVWALLRGKIRLRGAPRQDPRGVPALRHHQRGRRAGRPRQARRILDGQSHGQSQAESGRSCPK